MAEFEIANVVGTITYNQEIDLSELAETFEQRDEISSVTYEPSKNHYLQTRFEPNDTYVSFYRSGKCSIVGSISPEYHEEIVEKVNRVMRDILQFDYEPKSEVENIVVTTEVDSLPSLNAVAIGLGLEVTEYEPEQFSGLIYRGGRSVMIIFGSGKIVCTGLSDLDDIESDIDDLTEQIQDILF